MDQMKEKFNNLSLRKSLILYVVLFVFATIVLCMMTADLCNSGVNKINASYPAMGEKYYLTNERGERLGEGNYIGTAPVIMSEKDIFLTGLLKLLPTVMTPVYSALCILAAAFLFYRNRLKAPLTELRRASEKISQNDLDFVISCSRQDEMGELCASFEGMRKALAGSFSEIWRSMEERKRLNAAFAHELRTPLTVLKGYTEILIGNEDRQVQETAITMSRHLSRMERYVESMSRLQRLEDVRPGLKEVPLQSFLESLSEGADMLCRQNEKQIFIENRTVSRKLLVDTEFILQVSNNLISNAVRYARNGVMLSFEEKLREDQSMKVEDGGILLTVSDDGPGFHKEILNRGISPYATGEKGSTGHFGLGLYICKIFCERHGGWLKIENTDSGAKITAFFRSGYC